MKKPKTSTADEWRRVVHSRVEANPRFYIWVAYRLTRKSSRHMIRKNFATCAAATGCSSTKQLGKDVGIFLRGGKAPKYVLQCCSGKLSGQH